MKNFCCTVDDNIRFLKELSTARFSTIFEHPYLALYKRLHEKYGLKVQLNLFYEMDGFDLSMMTDRYRDEWLEISDWLKMSFHSRKENVKPYQTSGFDEVREDCGIVHDEIERFASPESLAKTTTLHYCLATHDGIAALRGCGVCGLVGLYGNHTSPKASYQNTPDECAVLRNGQLVVSDGMTYAAIDVVLNSYTRAEILEQLMYMTDRDHVHVMIHEQYFYPDYPRYQPDFEEKLDATFAFLTSNGFKSAFFEEIIGKKTPSIV